MASFGLILWLLAAQAEPLGRLAHPPIKECSGIVKSRRYADIFWVHNDSGNPPALYAVRRDGTLVREYVIGAPNVDWEDIATDDEGHLYIGDIGNNKGRLPLRAIYRVAEPDPSKPAEKPLKVDLATYYRFDKNGRFDAEGLFIRGKTAYIISKFFDGREAEVFALPLDPPAPLLSPATPRQVATLHGFVDPATGADLAADGSRLAVCSLKVARVYRRDGETWKPIGGAKYKADGIEAIAWDGDDLILAGEGREMIRVDKRTWEAGVEGPPRR